MKSRYPLSLGRTGNDLLPGELVIAVKSSSLPFFSLGEGKRFRRGKFIFLLRIASVDKGS